MHNKSWTTDLIGVIAEEGSLDNHYREVIYRNTQDILQFQIMLISQPPDSFPNVKFITAFASDLAKWGFEDDPYTEEEERKQNLRDFLNDSLLVFHVERKLLHNHNEVYQAKNIRLIPKAESYQNDVTLFPLPIFSQRAHALTYEEFLEKVTKRKFIGRIEGLSTEANDTPPFILWEQAEGSYLVFGEFDKHQYAHGGFSFSIRGELKSTRFLSEWLEDSYYDSVLIPNVIYVTFETYQYLTGSIEAADAIVPLVASQELSYTSLLKEEPTAKVSTYEETPIAVSKSPLDDKKATTISPTIEGQEVSKEERFLEYFISTTQEMGLLYAEKDLINFHTSIKSSNLVILAGMSGTGKSKLVQAYSRALGLYSDQFTFIPVRPAWTDDADLIGYADTLHMVYRPGDSGLINVLKQAEKEEDKLFIICFDEMNLARVEHYFSQFLSILEMDQGRRELRLYNDELATRLYNSAQYPPTITIKENVRFVGTVNLDESTYHFSDKVLDRANVIQLEVLPFSQMKDLGDKKKVVHSRGQVVHFEEYDSFINKNRSLELNDEELQFLWKMHLELQQVNHQIGIGQRIIRQIDTYLKNLPEQDVLQRKEAFDLQLVQRILTKVRGSEDQLATFIGTYQKSTDSVHKSMLLDLVEEASSISDFALTRKVILQKARELKLNGYII